MSEVKYFQDAYVDDDALLVHPIDYNGDIQLAMLDDRVRAYVTLSEGTALRLVEHIQQQLWSRRVAAEAAEDSAILRIGNEPSDDEYVPQHADVDAPPEDAVVAA